MNLGEPISLIFLFFCNYLNLEEFISYYRMSGLWIWKNSLLTILFLLWIGLDESIPKKVSFSSFRSFKIGTVYLIHFFFFFWEFIEFRPFHFVLIKKFALDFCLSPCRYNGISIPSIWMSPLTQNVTYNFTIWLPLAQTLQPLSYDKILDLSNFRAFTNK